MCRSPYAPPRLAEMISACSLSLTVLSIALAIPLRFAALSLF